MNKLEFSLKVIKPNSTDVVPQPLPLNEANKECTFSLRTFPGTSGLHLLFLREGSPYLRMEIPTNNRSGETIDVHVSLDEQNNLHVVCTHFEEKLILAKDEHYCPPALIHPCESGQPLDIAIVIDGTMQIYFQEKKVKEDKTEEYVLTGKLLLKEQEAWNTVIEKIAAFIEAISKEYPDCRTAVLAFGDQQPPNINADDLKPRYLLWPERESDRLFMPLNLTQVKLSLQAIPATSGGDFVDALADAMNACCRLHWRPKARKLVMLFGDSPGHSIIEPVVRGGDVCARKIDVDTVAMHMYSLGIELMTIYYNDSKEIAYDYYRNVHRFKYASALLNYTQKQYRELASLLEMAYLNSTFDAAKAVDQFCNRKVAIGRGAAFGELIAMTPEDAAKTE